MISAMTVPSRLILLKTYVVDRYLFLLVAVEMNQCDGTVALRNKHDLLLHVEKWEIA